MYHVLRGSGNIHDQWSGAFHVSPPAVAVARSACVPLSCLAASLIARGTVARRLLDA